MLKWAGGPRIQRGCGFPPNGAFLLSPHDGPNEDELVRLRRQDRRRAQHEALYSTESAAEIGVVFSIESSLAQEEAARAALANNRVNLLPDQLAPFWAASEALCDAVQPYDVVMFPDGTLRPDTVTPADLERYVRTRDRTCTFPGCRRRAALCDLDHITPWDDGGTTSAWNLHCLCRRHHRLPYQ